MEELIVGPYLAVLAEQIESTLTPDGGYAQAVARTCTTMLLRLSDRPDAVERSERVATAEYRRVLREAGVSIDDSVPVRDQVRELAGRAAQLPPDRARGLMAAIIRAERDCTEELLRPRPRPEKPESSPGDGLDAGQMRRLRHRLREIYGEDLEVTDVVEKAGGFSKRTIFASLRGAGAPPGVVIRLERDYNILGTYLIDEFPYVQHAWAAGVPAPEPILLETDRNVLGQPFAVYSLMPGEQIGDIDSTDQGSAELGVSLAGVLASLHTTPLDGLAAAKQAPAPAGRMARELEAFERRWREDGEPTLTLRIAFDWLRKNLHLAHGSPTMVHRDVGWHNMLVDDQRVTALLDWEMAAIGIPAQDLGYVYLAVTQMMPWEDFLTAYEKAGGTRPADPRQIDFFRVWREVWRCSNVRHAKKQIEQDHDRDFRLSAGVVIKLDGLELRLQKLLLEVMSAEAPDRSAAASAGAGCP